MVKRLKIHVNQSICSIKRTQCVNWQLSPQTRSVTLHGLICFSLRIARAYLKCAACQRKHHQWAAYIIRWLFRAPNRRTLVNAFFSVNRKGRLSRGDQPQCREAMAPLIRDKKEAGKKSSQKALSTSTQQKRVFLDAIQFPAAFKKALSWL